VTAPPDDDRDGEDGSERQRGLLSGTRRPAVSATSTGPRAPAAFKRHSAYRCSRTGWRATGAHSLLHSTLKADNVDSERSLWAHLGDLPGRDRSERSRQECARTAGRRTTYGVISASNWRY